MDPQPISKQSGKYCPACGYLNPSWRYECEQCQSKLGLGSQPISGPNNILCPSCGYSNAAWRSECERCQTKLKSPNRSTYTYEPERPGCVTAYAIFIGIVAGLIAIGGLFGGFYLMGGEGHNSGLAGLFVILVAGGGAVLEIVIARGLWLLKNWARILVIVLQSLSILINLISMCVSLSGSSDNSGTSIAGKIIATVINAYIVYWFANNGEYFK